MYGGKWRDSLSFTLMISITKQAIISFLRQVNILTLALTGERGPISSPLLFAVEDDLSHFYIATHRDSFKSSALQNNPRFSFSVWQFGKMLIQVDGIATEVKDEAATSSILDQLAKAASNLAGFWPPVLRIEGEGYIVFQLKPTWMRALDLSSNTILAGDNPFIEIPL